MKIKNIINHKHNAQVTDNNANPFTKPDAGHVASDKFSGEGLIAAAIDFGATKGKNTKTRLMQELNFNDYNRSRKTEGDRIMNLSEGTALFLAFDQKAYKPEDPYIKNAPFRTEVVENLKKENPEQEVFFVETAGVAEPGSGFFATVPIYSSHGATVTAGFGFSIGAILRYRTSQAVVGKKDAKAKIKLASPKALPINADAARKLAAGQEFEICGQGKLRGDANIGVRYGAGVGICTAGIAENVGVQATAAAEYGINVIALDGHDRVRVTIRKINQESIAAISNTAVGLIIPPNKLFPGNFGLPQFGHGLLKYFAEHKGPPNFEAYLTDYTSLTLNCSLTQTHKHLHLCSYDLDLKIPEAAEAYNALMRLDIREADAQALAHNGVIKVDYKETLHSTKAAARLALCTEKLYLKEALRSESHGELVNADGQHKVFRDKVFKKHYENYITSKKDALWESVNVKVDDEPAKTYYHFNYKKNDFITRQHEIDKFFKFADALGIKKAEGTQGEVVNMHTYKKILSSKDDSKLEVDLYFTSAGVEHMRAVSKADIALAYLSTSAELDDDVGHPRLSSDSDMRAAGEEIFEAYRQYRSKHHVFRSPHKIYTNKNLNYLKNKYFKLCGRDLKSDYRAIIKAERFAELSRHLIVKEHDRHKIGKFFLTLGQSHLSYAQGIATLAKIAGRENVLVHSLSASGGGIALKSVDEGNMVHPRDEAVKLTLRKAKPIENPPQSH